jgi:Phytanoyl-CoA dioxygenase (PhyH)
MAVIDEARGLADSGQYNEAIELLTAANRKSRQHEIDRMLLALRSEAVLKGDWTTERPEWPSQVADQFGGARIPEISGDELSVSSIRSGIENHGSLIVRHLITSNQVDLLRNNIDRVLTAFDAVGSGSVGSELEGWYEPFHRDRNTERPEKRSKGAVLTVDSPAAHFDLLETFESCGLSSVIRDFFGEPPALLSRKGTLRRVHHEGQTGGWHQDGGFLGEDIRSLNVWLALTDCGIDAPGMDIVAKRFPGIVETGSGFAKWATNPYAAHMVAEGHTVRPVFAAGDAIIFDHLCLHRTARSPEMTKTRYAIETWLIAPSTYTNIGDAILF